MKYVVELNGERRDVEVDGESVTLDGECDGRLEMSPGPCGSDDRNEVIDSFAPGATAALHVMGRRWRSTANARLANKGDREILRDVERVDRPVSAFPGSSFVHGCVPRVSAGRAGGVVWKR